MLRAVVTQHREREVALQDVRRPALPFRNRGLTLADVAEAAKISESGLSMIERGLREPTAPVAFRLASFYGFKVTEIWPSSEPSEGVAA